MDFETTPVQGRSPVNQALSSHCGMKELAHSAREEARERRSRRASLPPSLADPLPRGGGGAVIDEDQTNSFKARNGKREERKRWRREREQLGEWNPIMPAHSSPPFAIKGGRKSNVA